MYKALSVQATRRWIYFWFNPMRDFSRSARKDANYAKALPCWPSRSDCNLSSKTGYSVSLGWPSARIWKAYRRIIRIILPCTWVVLYKVWVYFEKLAWEFDFLTRKKLSAMWFWKRISSAKCCRFYWWHCNRDRKVEGIQSTCDV
jgi:hypothetical protein